MIYSYIEFIIEKNNRYIIVEQQQIDKLRLLNESLDEELSKDIFKYDDVYCKGGAARLALLLYVDKSYVDVVRDSDFVCICNYDINTNEDVEYVENFEKYFNSRDITLNEVLLRPDKLIFTKEAYRDAQKAIINPKGNISIANDNLQISTRLMARCILFAVRYSMNLINVTHPDDDDFNVFICLIKAYELNLHYKFFNMCKEYELANANNCKDVGDQLIYFLNDIHIHINKNILKSFTYDIINNLENTSKETKNNILSNYPLIKKEIDTINLEDVYDDVKNFGIILRKRNRIS